MPPSNAPQSFSAVADHQERFLTELIDELPQYLPGFSQNAMVQEQVKVALHLYFAHSGKIYPVSEDLTALLKNKNIHPNDATIQNVLIQTRETLKFELKKIGQAQDEAQNGIKNAKKLKRKIHTSQFIDSITEGETVFSQWFSEFLETNGKIGFWESVTGNVSKDHLTHAQALDFWENEIAQGKTCITAEPIGKINRNIATIVQESIAILSSIRSAHTSLAGIKDIPVLQKTIHGHVQTIRERLNANILTFGTDFIIFLNQSNATFITKEIRILNGKLRTVVSEKNKDYTHPLQNVILSNRKNSQEYKALAYSFEMFFNKSIGKILMEIELEILQLEGLVQQKKSQQEENFRIARMQALQKLL